MSSLGLATQVCVVTRLDSLGEAPPLEDEGPLSGCHLLCYILTQDTRDARQELREVQRLGQDIRQLRRSRDADKLHVAILDDLMSKVFPDVNVLGALAAADDIVPPFDTYRVVLVHRGRLRLRKTHTLEEVAKVEYLRSRRGRRVVFRFGRR